MKRVLAVTLVASLLMLGCSYDGRGPLVFAPDRLADARTGQPYEGVISVSGNVTPVGDLYVSDGGLPPGLTLDFTRGDSSGTVRGTPTTPGTYAFTIAAWCLGTNVSGQTGEHSYTLLVT